MKKEKFTLEKRVRFTKLVKEPKLTDVRIIREKFTLSKEKPKRRKQA